LWAWRSQPPSFSSAKTALAEAGGSGESAVVSDTAVSRPAARYGTDELDEDEDRDEDPEAVHELHDRLIEIRRVLDDLGGVAAELGATQGRREGERLLDDLRGEVDQLPDALAAAIARPTMTRPMKPMASAKRNRAAAASRPLTPAPTASLSTTRSS